MRPFFRTRSFTENSYEFDTSYNKTNDIYEYTKNLTILLHLTDVLDGKPEFIELEMNHLSKNVARLFEYWKQKTAQNCFKTNGKLKVDDEKCPPDRNNL